MQTTADGFAANRFVLHIDGVVRNNCDGWDDDPFKGARRVIEGIDHVLSAAAAGHQGDWFPCKGLVGIDRVAVGEVIEGVFHRPSD